MSAEVKSALVSKILEGIRQRAAAHADKRAIPKRGPRIFSKSRAKTSKVDSTPTWAHSVGHSKVDAFTRLWQSCPKPKILASRRHPVALHLSKLSNSASYRQHTGLMLLVGTKLIKESCALHGPCLRIYTNSHANPLLQDPEIQVQKVVAVTNKLLAAAAQVRSYKGGLIAEVPLPKPRPLSIYKRVICVGPTPQNADKMATVLRTATALGWDGAWILNHGTTDLMDPVCTRASQNSLAMLPFARTTPQEVVEMVQAHNMQVLVPNYECRFKDNENKGILLLVGQQPQQLLMLAINAKVQVQAQAHAKTASYKLDAHFKACIALYNLRPHALVANGDNDNDFNCNCNCN